MSFAALVATGCAERSGALHTRSEESFARTRPPSGVLARKTVAILVADGVQQVELEKPREALEEVGAKTIVISPSVGFVQAYKGDEKGDLIPVDLKLDQAKPESFDALLLPGGVKNPDELRTNADAIKLVRDLWGAGKPVAAICHAPWLLVEADAVKGRMVTSFPSLKTDLTNAGGTWVDRPVVVDGPLVTSRKPDDIGAFNEKMIETFRIGIQPVRAEPTSMR